MRPAGTCLPAGRSSRAIPTMTEGPRTSHALAGQDGGPRYIRCEPMGVGEVMNSSSGWRSGARTMATDLDPITEAAGAIMNWLPRGAFLTVRHEARLNTMTIGWATVGVVWSRPVCMVAVRDSRYTFGLIEAAADFTVSVPTTPAMNQALAFCGSRSGRDVDKFAACSLVPQPARKTASPIVSLVGVHLECTVICRSAIDPARLAERLSSLYPKRDYHSLYFGEVRACYRTDSDSDAPA